MNYFSFTFALHSFRISLELLLIYRVNAVILLSVEIQYLATSLPEVRTFL